MNSNRPALYIRTIFAVMALLLSFAWVANAHADTKNDPSQMTISPNGSIMIRGGIVTSIEGNTVVIATSWGKATFVWTVELNGSTRFVPQMGSKQAIAMVKVDDPVSLSGELDNENPHPTVIATVFKDNALYQDGATIAGQVVSIDAMHHAMAIKNDAGTTMISVVGGTIMTKGGNRIGITAISAGDTVKATGGMNHVTDTMVVDRLEVSAPVAVAHTTLFASIIAWLTSNRGALSVRDR